MCILRSVSRAVCGLALAVVVSSGQAAWAQFDNPGVLDFITSGGSAGDTNNGASAFMGFFLSTQVGNVFAIAGNRQTSGGGNTAQLTFFLFEPDKITRKPNGGKVKQSLAFVQVAFGNATTTTTASFSTFVPDCSGQVQAKDTDGDLFPETMKWKGKCKDPVAALTALGLSGPQQAQFMAIYGPDMIVKGKAP